MVAKEGRPMQKLDIGLVNGWYRDRGLYEYRTYGTYVLYERAFEIGGQPFALGGELRPWQGGFRG